MGSGWLVGCLLTAVYVGPPAAPKAKALRVLSVEVVGVEHLDERYVRARLAFDEGDEIAPADVGRAFRRSEARLRTTLSVADVQIRSRPERGGIVVTVTIEEASVSVLGNLLASEMSARPGAAFGSLGIGIMTQTGNVWLGARGGTEQALTVALPDLTDRLSLGASFEYLDPFFTERIDDAGRTFASRSVGGGARLSLTVSDLQISGELGVSLETLERSDRTQTTDLFPIVARVSMSHRTTGHRVSIGAFGAHEAKAATRWVGLETSGASYVEVAEHHVLAGRLWLGMTSPNTPLHHRWSAAGARAVRAPVTGRLYGRYAVRAHVEYRWCALETNAGTVPLEATLAAFVDAGAAAVAFSQLSDAEPVVASGPAFRVHFSAPLALDLAVEYAISTVGQQLFVTTERPF